MPAQRTLKFKKVADRALTSIDSLDTVLSNTINWKINRLPIRLNRLFSISLRPKPHNKLRQSYRVP